MPYRRRGYRRRNGRYGRYKRHTFANQRVGDVANKALSIATSIKKYMLNPEKNNFDTSGSAVALATTWSIVNLSNIAEGDDSINRTGRSVKMLGINFRGGISLPAAATSNYRCRVVVFVDRMQIGGADPGATNIFNTDNIDSQRNQQGAPGRFRFLCDRVFNMSQGDAGCRNFLCKKPLNFVTKYIGTAGVDASNFRNAVYLAYVTDSVAGAAPLISWTNRLWFVDN